MLRTLVFTPLLLIALVAAGLYAHYGEIEPCRVLAVERASHADVPLPFAQKGAEVFERYRTSQMTSRACARDLLDAWAARIKAAWT